MGAFTDKIYNKNKMALTKERLLLEYSIIHSKCSSRMEMEI